MNCPECGTNILKSVQYFYDLDSHMSYDIGIWREYKKEESEGGIFLCENDHEFTVDAETYENIL